MKRKLEDKLLQLSFGDLTPDEERRVRQEAANDPEAQRVLEECNSLREDLKLLTDIPDHQISSERIQQAILARGLKRETSGGSRFGWLWAPAAVAMVTFAIVVAWRGNQSSGIPVGGFASVAHKPETAGPILNAPSSVLAKNDAAKPVESAAPDEALPAAADYANAEPSVSVSARPRSAKASSPRMTLMTAAAQQALADQPKSSDEVAMADPSNDPLVLIAADADDDTGAKRATEVDNANNVLISG